MAAAHFCPSSPCPACSGSPVAAAAWVFKSAPAVEAPVELTLAWEAKLASVEQRIIEGHAAITGNLDLNGDVILPGAFAGTVSAGPASVKVLIGHDYSALPVGRVIELREDAKGLYARARILETAAGDDLLTVAKDAHDHGESIGMSIGYRVKDYAYAEREVARGNRQLVREIKDLEVREFSFVVFPANPKAVTTGVKAEGRTLTLTVPEGASLEDARALFDEAVAGLVTKPVDPPEEPPAVVLASWEADAMLARLALRGAL